MHLINLKKFTETENRIKESLLQQGASKKEIAQITKQLKNDINNIPLPKIAIIGFTGVGKSTTLNALFNAGQPTSNVRPCTSYEAPIIGEVSKYTGSRGSVIIYDMPGLGEDIYSDKRHLETYKRVLPIVDIAVWTFHVGDRSMTPMQQALQILIEYLGDDFQERLMFAINKADAISPGELAWNTTLNAPSPEQRKNITELESYVREKIQQIMPRWKGSIVTYSAKTRFKISQLMTAMIESLPKDRRWVLGAMADVADPSELMNNAYRDYVKSLQKSVDQKR